MLKLKQMAVAVTLALPMLASAQTNAELKSEIDLLKAQINELKAMMKQQAAAPATAAPAGGEAVDPAEFAQVRTKVEALIDDKETSGFKGLRISGGIDPTYIYNRAKGTASFSYLNNFAPINGSGEVASYDNSYSGLAYIDFQKEMEGGSKFRLTLAPSKSAASSYNLGNIVHEASASIPLDGAATRLVVGQIPDVSGYEQFFNSYAGANAITSNQLYPGYAEYFISRNLLFDFTEASFYTGVGLDLTQGPWEWKLFLANFNSARNDVNGCPAATPAVGLTPGSGNITCKSLRSPTFIYNATYAKEEFWGFEFTGYEGKVTNWVQTAALGQPITSRLDQFEIDGNYTRGDFNGNLQFTVGRQKDAALIGLIDPTKTADAKWWGLSGLVSERVTNRLTLAARADYLNNEKNGGGTFVVSDLIPNGLDTSPSSSGYAPHGDFYNGFGPGDPNAAGYDPTKGANRYALAFSATYRLTPNVAFRGEYRHDHSTTQSFYVWKDGTFRDTNDIFGFQTIVNF